MLNLSTKKFFLYVSISGAIFVGILALLSIWGALEGNVIRQTFSTYVVTMVAIALIDKTIKRYEKFANLSSLILNIGMWILILSLC